MSEGYLILKIIYSVTKYGIKHPVVYFVSSMSTLNNSSAICVIRHILTKIIGTCLYCGTNFLNTLCAYGISIVHVTETNSILMLLSKITFR